MFEGDFDLDIEEEERIQSPANIYSLIKTLQFIEWAYNSSHIDRDTYVKETNIILEQYKNAVAAYPEYKGLENFVREYKLEDCNYAINRINRGNAQENKKPVLGEIQKMTQCFNDINIVLDTENLSVSDILPYYNEICNCFDNLKNYINIQCNNLENNTKVRIFFKAVEENFQELQTLFLYIL